MSEMNSVKLFTVEEANRLLPKIEKMIADLRRQRDLILSQEVEIDALELVTQKKGPEVPPVLSQKIEAYHQTADNFYKAIDKIEELGCLLKDLDMGLIDFYTRYEGRVVHLCWHTGEKEITTWHEIGKGYAHRQPINPGK